MFYLGNPLCENTDGTRDCQCFNFTMTSNSVGSSQENVSQQEGGSGGTPVRRRRTVLSEPRDVFVENMKKFLVHLEGYQHWKKGYGGGNKARRERWDDLARAAGIIDGGTAKLYFKKIKEGITYRLERSRNEITDEDWKRDPKGCKAKLETLYGYEFWPFCDFLTKYFIKQKFGVVVEDYTSPKVLKAILQSTGILQEVDEVQTEAHLQQQATYNSLFGWEPTVIQQVISTIQIPRIPAPAVEPIFDAASFVDMIPALQDHDYDKEIPQNLNNEIEEQPVMLEPDSTVGDEYVPCISPIRINAVQNSYHPGTEIGSYSHPDIKNELLDEDARIELEHITVEYRQDENPLEFYMRCKAQKQTEPVPPIPADYDISQNNFQSMCVGLEELFKWLWLVVEVRTNEEFKCVTSKILDLISRAKLVKELNLSESDIDKYLTI